LSMDFDLSPLLVVWEVTEACDLACTYCRDSVRPNRDSAELTADEARQFLAEVKDFGNPLMILSGGDPLKRADIFDLIRHSVAVGLRTNITPSPTPLLTAEAIDQFRSCGISRMAIGLDGPDAPTHDTVRQAEGSFERAISALRHARNIGLDTQVLTVLTPRNLAALGQIAEQVADVRAKLWSLFFPISAPQDLTTEQYEKVFEFLYEISKVAPFEVKTTEALHYRRYIAQRLKAEHGGRGGANARLLWRTTAVGEGRGFLFVSHTGEIYPSGYLRISAGNVRNDSLVDVYRNSGLFRSLRDPAAREGKCGYCEYGRICGGSRARAYAMTGDYLAPDPKCCYQPVNQPELVTS